jgi:hypothetical protein
MGNAERIFKNQASPKRANCGDKSCHDIEKNLRHFLNPSGIAERSASLMMTVRDYPGIKDWPPTPGGAYAKRQSFPLGENVIITEIFPVRNEFVTFTCEFQGAQHTYDLSMTDIGMAEEFARLMQRHVVGKTLEKFGDFRLDI